ncbi:RNA-guided endonuclease IscB [Ligilactobacillus equi]|uniref:RNA-guided endonuclease IscB n=1 Tax=Ligilactobacillus equi TaxID=137357 RepID=UPI002ED4284A
MSQNKIDYVYVVDSNGRPVMPTSRLGMVRRWLKSGQAIWYGNSRKTIQFVRPITTRTQELTLGVDTGFHLGISVVGNQREYYASESIRKSEKDKILIRREYRKVRRSRLHYRKPRYDNRKPKAKWLAPSIKHRIEFTVTEIQRIYEFLPISKLVFEIASFSAWSTKSRNHGYKDTKSYLLARDKNHDALDGKVYPSKQLRIHHLIQKKDGGTNQYSNLVLISDKNHNQANHINGTLAELVTNRGEITNFEGENFINYLINRLDDYFSNYEMMKGYTTAKLREQYGIEKSHLNDAFVIAGGTNLCDRTNNVYLRSKVPNNNRCLQKFYDAKYIDSRDGQKKSGKELSSGRTRRSREIDYDNLRIFRQRKVTKGRFTVRKSHYQLRPHDIVRNMKTNKIEVVKGVNSGGINVVFQTGKSVRIYNCRCLYHVNGLVEEKLNIT